jgi:hypothetical protein
MDAFCQVRTRRRAWRRAWRLGVSQLLCLGRHTLTDLLCTCGRQTLDWSADYRLFSEDHWEPDRLFAVVMDHVLARLPAGCPLVLAMDDTQLKKTGPHVPGAGYRRDPLSPKFHCNLIWAQRFLQVSAPLYTRPGPGAARCIPVAYEHAPSVAHPKKSDPPQRWKEYRQQCKRENLSTRGVDLLKRLRSQMDCSPHGKGRRMVVGVDGSYTNTTVLRGLPAATVLIGRIRKDLSFFDLPGPAAGAARRYGARLPTPEQLRQDPGVAWQKVQAFAAGKLHEFEVKTLGPVLWKKVGWRVPLRLIVIRPLGYRLRKASRLLYRQPAHLICTDVQMPLGEALQYYLWRWGIEVNHRDEKQLIGVGQAQVTNELSARRQPAFAVFSYALLLLAATDTWGVDAIEQRLPAPKWRQKSCGQLSTQQMIQELRKEAWAYALNHLADHGEGLVNAVGGETKPADLPDALASALLYGSAA